MTDAAAIAKGLTEAQAKMLRWNCAGYVLLTPGWARWRLKRKGLIRPFLRDFLRHAGWQPTDLGLAVRKCLPAIADQSSSGSRPKGSMRSTRAAVPKAITHLDTLLQTKGDDRGEG